MHRSRTVFACLLILGIVAASWLPTNRVAAQPALADVSAAASSYLQSIGSVAVALPAVVPPTPMLGNPTDSSVMPPGPASGARCSALAGTQCSALLPNRRCSAFNDNGNDCSTLSAAPGFDELCSTNANNTVCSVLPPSAGGNPSTCSAYGGDSIPDYCSTLGVGSGQKCSTKGSGLSSCSVITGTGGLPAFCSVFNTGATTRGFCSTKFNQPTFAKSCSTISNGGECSVEIGAIGTCTTFGAAAPGSCSAIGGTSGHCSVMFSPQSGNFCVQ